MIKSLTLTPVLCALLSVPFAISCAEGDYAGESKDVDKDDAASEADDAGEDGGPAPDVGETAETGETPPPVDTNKGPAPEPPFDGTIFLDPDIITTDDPSTFQGVTYVGIENREVFDRRTDSFLKIDVHVFKAAFSDGLQADVQVNPEFGDEATAKAEADKYALAVGRVPKGLRSLMKTVTVHKGENPFGGGGDDLLIHTEQADLYVQDGILEETMMHELSHTSLDPTFETDAGWLAARSADASAISTYARDNPDREDIAESFVPYWAVTHRSDRISKELADKIRATIPKRIEFFDANLTDMEPVQAP